MIFKDEEQFNKFRQAHPELRFWQALLAYAEVDKIILKYKDGTEHDTFYFQDVKIKK